MTTTDCGSDPSQPQPTVVKNTLVFISVKRYRYMDHIAMSVSGYFSTLSSFFSFLFFKEKLKRELNDLRC